MLPFRIHELLHHRSKLLPLLLLLTMPVIMPTVIMPAVPVQAETTGQPIKPLPSSGTVTAFLDSQFPVTPFFSEMAARFRNPSRPVERYQFLCQLDPSVRFIFYEMCTSSERFELFKEAARVYLTQYPENKEHVEGFLTKLAGLLTEMDPFIEKKVMLSNGGEYYIRYYESLTYEEKRIRNTLARRLIPPSLYISHPTDTLLSRKGVEFFQTFAARFPSAGDIVRTARQKNAIFTGSSSTVVSDGLFVQLPKRMQSAGCICISNTEAQNKCGRGKNCGGYGSACTPITVEQGGARCGTEQGTAPCLGICVPESTAIPEDPVIW